MISTAATEELRRRLENIRDETKLYANTANRIGNALLALLSFFEGAQFLRKEVDDTASGFVRFLKGLESGGNASIKGDAFVGKDGFASGLFGFGARIGRDGIKLKQYNDLMEIAENYLSGCLSFLNQKNGDALPLRGSRCHIQAIGD